jgi:hypothetical protein
MIIQFGGNGVVLNTLLKIIYCILFHISDFIVISNRIDVLDTQSAFCLR